MWNQFYKLFSSINQPMRIAEECLRNSETEEEGHIGSQEPRPIFSQCFAY